MVSPVVKSLKIRKIGVTGVGLSCPDREHGAGGMLDPTAIHFGAVYCVYDDDYWLPFSLKSVYGLCSKILVLAGARPWNGPPTDNSATLAAARSFPDPGGKVEIISGTWSTETEQRNYGLQALRERGVEFCMVVDADEVYDEVQLERMMRLAAMHREVDCWHASWFTYWKSKDFRIDPPESFKPVVFLNVYRTRFTEHRNAQAPQHAAVPPEVGLCHHFSYARTNDELLKKLASFSHAHEIQPGWYEKVWLAWDADHSLENLHPVYPEAYKRAVPQPAALLPPVIRAG